MCLSNIKEARELNWALSLEKINGLSLCKVYQVHLQQKQRGMMEKRVEEKVYTMLTVS